VGQRRRQAALPTRSVLRLRVSVARETGEGASLYAAGVVGTAEQRPVGESHLAAVQPAGKALLDGGDQLDERAQAAVVLRLRGQVREPAREHAPDQTEELAVEEIPIAAWQTARATSSASVTCAGLPGRAGTGYSSAKTYAATTRASRSAVISRLHLEGHVWKPSFVPNRRVPARNPPVEINPLARGDVSGNPRGDPRHR
jgi:hypothetical protein